MVCETTKRRRADAIKFLLYYDVDGDSYVNLQKQAYIERLGSECQAEGLPFFLEILSYDETIEDNASVEFAKVKPRKVNEAMKVFSDERFGVDVLKVEVPVNMNFVEGFGTGEVVYTKEEALNISVSKKHQRTCHTFILVQVFQLNSSKILWCLLMKQVQNLTVFFAVVQLGRVLCQSILNKVKKRA